MLNGDINTETGLPFELARDTTTEASELLGCVPVTGGAIVDAGIVVSKTLAETLAGTSAAERALFEMNAKLRMVLDNCSAELSDKKEQVQNLEVSVAAYARENVDQQEQITSMQRSLDAVDKTHRLLYQKLEESRAEAASNKEKLEEMVSEFEAQREEYAAEIAAREKEAGQLRQQVKNLQAWIDNDNQKVGRLQSDLKQEREDNNRLARAVQRQHESLMDKDAQIARSNADLNKLGRCIHKYKLSLANETACLAVLSGLERIAPEHNGIIPTDELFELRDKVRDILERVRLRDAEETVPQAEEPVLFAERYSPEDMPF